MTESTPPLSWEQESVPEIPPNETAMVPSVPDPVIDETVVQGPPNLDGVTEVVAAVGTVSRAGARNLDNWRAAVHQITPVIISIFVTAGVATQDFAMLWVPLVFAIADPLLSYTNTEYKARKVVYGVLGVLQSGGLIVALLGSSSPWVPVISAGLSAISSLLARFYTPTSTVVPADSPRAVHAAPQ